MNPIWEVPDFTQHLFRERRSRFVVLIPVLNEGARIHAELERMRSTQILRDYDTVIVDGGSEDGAVAPSFLEEAGLRALLVKTGPGRLGAQLRVGLAWVMDEGYEGAILIDGNNKDDPAAIKDFECELLKGFDHVQGSRFVKGGVHRNTPVLRSLGIRLLHAPLISLAAGVRYTDTTNGFRAYSRRFLLDSRVQPFREVFSAYALHYYLAIRAGELGFSVKEIPVVREYPDFGKLPTKIGGLSGNWAVLRTLFKSCFHRFDPPQERVSR